MIPDNWGFVVAAYAVAAGTFLAYWRRLVRRERELSRRSAARGERSRS